MPKIVAYNELTKCEVHCDHSGRSSGQIARGARELQGVGAPSPEDSGGELKKRIETHSR